MWHARIFVTSNRRFSTQPHREKLFDKILIANRGEIACRVMRTCRALGIRTVAIYSDADANSMHVHMADEAVNVGPAPSAQSYLVMDNIYKAIEQTGAQAVHPGYGFLSERAAFSKGLESRGVKFIGPKEHAMLSMGDKIRSKEIARAAKVSTIPGVLTKITNDDELVKVARSIGYPVMIKASAGGGGKGMRIAWNDEEAKQGYRLSKEEARSSFGDDTIFLEKFIETPRHIEIQVLLDSHGHGVYLNERECSIQRRNQKVIEEAPSVFLDPATRKAMGEQALALAKAVNYESAGTVEFLVDKNRNFYFLEMNTRLQVEHAITEMITGVDIVHQMIRVAAGHRLNITQNDVPIKGWSFESRVYAEDPTNNFLPSIGFLQRYIEPTKSEHVRVDTGVRDADPISIYYDPMISKLVTHGKDRAQALQRMREALDSYVIRGLKHNVSFLRTLCDHPRFISGNISTKFIEEEFPGGYKGHQLSTVDNHALVSAAVAVHAEIFQQAGSISGNLDRANFTTALEKALSDVVVTIGRHTPLFKQFRLNVELDREVRDNERGFLVRIKQDGEGERLLVSSSYRRGDLVFKIEVNKQVYTVQVVEAGHTVPQYTLQLLGTHYTVEVRTPRQEEMLKYMPVKQAVDTSRMVVSPMPGRVFSLNVKPGDSVVPGQEVCIIEAMKMQNALRAQRAGKIKSVKVKVGDTVAADDVLVDFE